MEKFKKLYLFERPLCLFWAVVIFYFFYLCLIQANWALSGGMWAEMGTNYFPNASANSWAERLFSTDFGYIPLPQRLIALLGYELRLSASVIPYFYTWTGIVLTGLMVGVFCLERFRVLIKSDALRFFAAIIVLMMADFQTRTFINFTYFSVFFITIIIALAWVDKAKQVPRWAWIIPVLIISKPAVLAVIPAMMAVAMVSQSRFRWIAVVTVFLAIIQILQMLISQKAGIDLNSNQVGILGKITASLGYFFIFLDSYLLGKAIKLKAYFSMITGIMLFIILSVVISKKRKTPETALIILGFLLLFFNILLNCFALSDDWNLSFNRLDSFSMSRHTVVGFWGVVLIIVGLSSWIFQRKNKWGIWVLVGWFLLSGWLLSGLKMTHQSHSPTMYNSQWQEMSTAIDEGVRPLCVPLDPLGWIYSRNCSLLNFDLKNTWLEGFEFDLSSVSSLEIDPPLSLLGKRLVSLAILVRPASAKDKNATTAIEVKADIVLKDGEHKLFVGHQVVPALGGLVMLVNKHWDKNGDKNRSESSVAIKDINSVNFNFNQPVFLASLSSDLANNSNREPVILWMGN